MNYYPHNIGDYMKDTAHLGPLEDGIYRRMLDLYYSTEAPLPNDLSWLLKRLRLDAEKHAGIVSELLRDFFKDTGNEYRHSRCDIEIGKAQDKRRKAAESAGIRWHKDTDANAMRTQSEGNASEKCERYAPNPNPNPNPNPKKDTTEPLDANALRLHKEQQAARFARFWAEYPNRKSKAKAEIAFRRIDPDDLLLGLILDAVRKQASTDDWRKEGGKYIPHPTTWLNGRRWEDELGVGGAKSPAATVGKDGAAEERPLDPKFAGMI